MKLFLNFVILVSLLSISCTTSCTNGSSKSSSLTGQGSSAIGQQEAALGIRSSTGLIRRRLC